MMNKRKKYMRKYMVAKWQNVNKSGENVNNSEPETGEKQENVNKTVENAEKVLTGQKSEDSQVTDNKGKAENMLTESARDLGNIHCLQKPEYHPEISQKRFEGKGRGVPVDGFVLVANGLDCAVVTEADWRERLAQQCEHGYWGWSCKKCL